VTEQLPVDVRGLVKRFGRTTALDGLDLRVRRGEVHGFLGPNGSGKTTTLRVLLGLLRRDAGVARLFGADPRRDAVELHRRLAYVPGDVALWPELTGGETIDFLTALRGGVDQARRDSLVDRFALDPTVRGRAYSRGNRQKVALVAALPTGVTTQDPVRQQPLVVPTKADRVRDFHRSTQHALQEPVQAAGLAATALDPIVDAEFRRAIGEERDRGRTVLLSSHVLSEVEALCDRMTIIHRGRTVESGSLLELRHLTRTTVISELAGPVPRLDDLTGVHTSQLDGRRVVCEAEPAAMQELMRRLASTGIVRLDVRPPTLEQLFLADIARDTGVETS